jgi:hypothetical protein
MNSLLEAKPVAQACRDVAVHVPEVDAAAIDARVLTALGLHHLIRVATAS